MAPDLFGDISHFHTFFAARKHVESIVIDLARTKRLYLTDIINQKGYTQVLASYVINGITLSRQAEGHLGRREEPAIIPVEVASYLVGIRSLDGSNVTFKRGMEEIESPHLGSVTAWDSGDNDIRRLEEVHIDCDSPEVELPVQLAWLALTQRGKHCVPAQTRSSQKLFWKLEEIKPKGLVSLGKIAK